MKKDDNISIVLSIIINIIILLLIPKLSVKEVVNKKIKVGLIAYDNNKKTKLEGKNNSNSKKKNITEKITKQEKKDSSEVIVKKNDNKKKIDLVALDSIAKNITTPKVDVIVTEISDRKSKNIKIPKKELREMELPLVRSKSSFTENLTFEKETIPEKVEKLDLGRDKLSFNSQASEDIEFDRILDTSNIAGGLPSGYKLGVGDGDIVAKWDDSNKEPIYPEIAQVKGLQGTVKIKMFIDENGDVKNLIFEKGSGVPEINNAIEEVGRTWKIQLSKNGLNVAGDVVLEYKFVLK